ncbi:MAG: uracil-DNA glycosylase [Patescibacteria group bacterium]
MEKAKALEKVAEEIEKCELCPLFVNKKAVPGFGNPEAKILLIGEAPGYHESVQGLPFVGASGKLLEKLFAEIGVNREDVWIGNMIKHRPPDNRDPEPAELKVCLPFLERQLEVIKPELVITLGRFSMSLFFPEEKISQIHGQARFAQFGGRKITVVPMYHPAVGLRNPGFLSQLKEDFKKIPVLLGEKKLELKKEENEEKDPQMNLL